ncbi:MAG: UvrD-helicase domain-containing protein [Acidimicrobiales bacterium]
MTEELVDGRARQRIRDEAGTSMVVVAGAGTGKTTELVQRVVAMVRDGHVPLHELAVITFTEAAAAQLRMRVRKALDEAATASPHDAWLAQASSEIDEATICTLHAFAQRILGEHALAAGLIPTFDVLDEVNGRADFDEAMRRLLDRLFDDPAAQDMVLDALAMGVGPAELSELAWSMHRQWDRIEDGGGERLEADAAQAIAGAKPADDVARFIGVLDAALSMTAYCNDAGDLLLAHLEGPVREARTWLAGALDQYRALHEYGALGAGGDGPLAGAAKRELLSVMRAVPKLACRRGQAPKWADQVEEARRRCDDAEQARTETLAAMTRPLMAQLLVVLARFTLDQAARRVESGRLTFHDLLVHARRLVRDDAAARAALRRRYRRLLVDEFQDTDPLQAQLAGWLASSVDGTGNIADARPGSLFVVGDPKQSLYRFRRAEVSLFAEVSRQVGEELVLSSNFRSAPGLIAFVNAVFGALFDPDAPGQTHYEALIARRDPMPASATGAGVQLQLGGIADDQKVAEGPAPVVLLGGELDAPAGEVRREAARDIARALHRARAGRWPVSEPGATTAAPRPVRWRDMAVLIPTRNSLAPIEESFDEYDIPMRLEGAALLWGSDDVRDVLLALSAADDPSDSLAVLGALRTPGLGCGDDDLVTWVSAGGSWDPRRGAPPSIEAHPVSMAMDVLAGLHALRVGSDPSELVVAAIERLGAMANAFAFRRPRDHWHRLHWLVDQARVFDDTVGGTLHGFLQWAQRQSEDDGRAPVLGPPESDDDAVRVMTVHGSKGLEFPLVVVAGLERDESVGYRSDPVLWNAQGSIEARFSAHLATDGYKLLADADRALEASERVRLLYVAMTRARDHLLLCLHHKARGQSHAQQLAELCRSHPLLVRRIPDLDDVVVPPPPPDGGDLDPAVRAAAAQAWTEETMQWETARAAKLCSLRAIAVLTASELSHRSHGDPGDSGDSGDYSGDGPLDRIDPGWVEPADIAPGRGDTGLEIGRAVHGVLAAVDLAAADDSEVERLAHSLSGLHGVPDEQQRVRAMVDSALRSDVIRRAGTRRHFKEMYVGTTIERPGREDAVFEGFVDLLYEDDDGLVVVDYKTDRIVDSAAFSAAVGRYSRQVAAYALAVERATGRPVVRCVLLMLGAGHEASTVEVTGDALAAARAEALAGAALVG